MAHLFLSEVDRDMVMGHTVAELIQLFTLAGYEPELCSEEGCGEWIEVADGLEEVLIDIVDGVADGWVTYDDGSDW